MTSLFNTLRTELMPVGLTLAILTASVSLVSCGKGDDLEIQNDFPFEVGVMPVPKEVANGQTVEIRLTIQRKGNYSNTRYFLRYFQFDGQGTLRHYGDPAYLPNDLYALPAEQFRLYYTSHSTVSQSFDVWISDNFGNERKLSFAFNSSD
ncbi:DUF3872 domain-containing protein [Pedobacter sp. ASV28]|uniref:DUF3872 domain-containing protein n=1 Tax=Pedobacter sp. ASV28 TaxID=2795123 RepID=UPI0018ED62AD|nr:DUF3872 domain-containing protein [Pedobacter sp. ASV28]